MVSNLNELKKQVFYDMLNLSGRVFVHVRHSNDVIIGSRGFLPEEKEKGIVLVFNRQINFEWNNSGISAKLAFGTNSQKCFIPSDEILSVFSPELKAQFSISPDKKQVDEAPKNKKMLYAKPEAGQKVVKVDFSKKT